MENKLNDIIKNRRATPARFLAKTEVLKEHLDQILENANWAPNHKNTEPWRFNIYTGNAKQKLADKIFKRLTEKINSREPINPQKVEKLKSTLENVPVVMVIILERDIAERIPEWEELAAVAMAVQNMWLTATDLGLGAFWATPQFLPFLTDILEIQPQQKALGFFYVGHIAMDYPSPGRGDVSQKVKWME